jgi:hypothetical protein
MRRLQRSRQNLMSRCQLLLHGEHRAITFQTERGTLSSVWQEKLLDEHQQKVSGGEAHLETMIKDLKSEISG